MAISSAFLSQTIRLRNLELVDIMVFYNCLKFFYWVDVSSVFGFHGKSALEIKF